MPISNFRYLLWLPIILVAFTGTPLLGQSAPTAQATTSQTVFDQATQQDVSERLKAIYQRGAFRGAAFKALGATAVAIGYGATRWQAMPLQ